MVVVLVRTADIGWNHDMVLGRSQSAFSGTPSLPLLFTCSLMQSSVVLLLGNHAYSSDVWEKVPSERERPFSLPVTPLDWTTRTKSQSSICPRQSVRRNKMYTYKNKIRGYPGFLQLESEAGGARTESLSSHLPTCGSAGSHFGFTRSSLVLLEVAS